MISMIFTFYVLNNNKIFFPLQNIVEKNLKEKTKMQDEKDHQTRLIDRWVKAF